MSAAKRVAHAAETVRARWEQQVSTDPQTEAAQALEDTGQLLDPEVAAELVAFRKGCELAEVVAREGALPVPVGPEPRTLDVVEDELTGVSLSLYEEELTSERLRWALASAKRGRARLRAQVADSEQRSERRRIAWRMAYQRAMGRGWAADRAGERARQGQTAMQDMLAGLLGAQMERDAALARVAELEAERRSTNESLDDAVQELRARQGGGCTCPPQDRPHQVGCRLDGVPDALTATFAPVTALREDEPLKGCARLDASAAVAAEATHWKRLGMEDPHDGPLAHSYRVSHDLDVPGGTS